MRERPGRSRERRLTRASCRLAAAWAAAVAHNALAAEAAAVPDPAAYCANLLRVTDIAGTSGKFTFIAGKEREGDFRETTMSLAGWRECLVYGPRTYTCEFGRFATAAEAEQALAITARDVTACLGQQWAVDTSRSSSDYVLVQSARDAASMTLSTDAVGDSRPRGPPDPLRAGAPSTRADSRRCLRSDRFTGASARARGQQREAATAEDPTLPRYFF